MHFRDTFEPRHYIELSKDQNNNVLASHMFLEGKRDGTIKGRTVVGRNKQREFISKEDFSSATVATEAVLFSCIIYVEEEMDLAAINIPNVLIQKQVES